MENFILKNPVKIIFGRGELVKLTQELDKNRRILLTYGCGSIKKTEIYDKIIGLLAGFDYIEFGGIEPNPSYKTLMKGIKLAREKKVDFLLGIGGGSVIDGTKFIAAGVHYPSDPLNILKDASAFKEDLSIENTLDFGVILTLPAAGSEMNCISVISNEDDKLPFKNLNGYPKFSILDPETSFSLNQKQIALGVVDSFVHVIEQYLTYSSNCPLQDRFSEGILKTLIEEAPKALENHDDYNVRANLMLCSTMALNGLIGIGVPSDWTSHKIGHELTALFDLSHAETLAILLPAVLKIKRENKKEKLLQYGARVWNLERNDIDEVINTTRDFFENLNIATRLSYYSIMEKDLPRIIANVAKHNICPMGEKRDITIEVVWDILREAL